MSQINNVKHFFIMIVVNQLYALFGIWFAFFGIKYISINAGETLYSLEPMSVPI